MVGEAHVAQVSVDVDRWHDPGLCDELNPISDSPVECISYELGGPVESA